MKKFLLAALSSVAAFAAAAPAQSAVLSPGTEVTFTALDDFTPLLGTLVSQQGAIASSGSAGTFAATLRSAVYLNSLGTLDFVYQASHDAGPAIRRLSAAEFGNFLTDVFFFDGDIDGAGGIFTAANNGGNTAGDSTADRSLDGNTIGVNFALSNPVGLNETSATYVFRTNATQFGQGSGGLIDGMAFTVAAFAPVPEPATWAMMLVGFGAVGYSMRRRPKYRLVQAV